MSRKNQWLALTVVGLLIGLVSALAEPLGLGRDNGFGSRQWTGTIIGALVLLVGLALYAKEPKTR